MPRSIWNLANVKLQVLGFRYDCKSSGQVWCTSTCADVTITKVTQRNTIVCVPASVNVLVKKVYEVAAPYVRVLYVPV